MEKTKATVIFLIDKSLKDSVFAYFPEIYEGAGVYLVYAHVGQHHPCRSEYAVECKSATPKQYTALKAELEGIGYELKVYERFLWLYGVPFEVSKNGRKIFYADKWRPLIRDIKTEPYCIVDDNAVYFFYNHKLVTMSKMKLKNKIEFSGLPRKGSKIDNIEIQPVTESETDNGVTSYEPYHGDDPQQIAAYSVYLHIAGEGVVCVADCDTQATANALYDLLKYVMLNVDQPAATELLYIP